MMAPVRIFFLVLILATLLGCATTASTTRGHLAPTDLDGRILAPARLAQGGTVAVVPFSAGENVSQTEVLEKIVFHCLRGITEGLVAQDRLVLASADKVGGADFVIKGRVVKISERKNFPKVFTAKRTRTLAIEGEMLLRRSGQAVARFRGSRTSQGAQNDFSAMAEQIGQEIAAFLVAEIKK